VSGIGLESRHLCLSGRWHVYGRKHVDIGVKSPVEPGLSEVGRFCRVGWCMHWAVSHVDGGGGGLLHSATFSLPSRGFFMRSDRIIACLLTVCLASGGCRSVPWPNVWPFPERELTTYRTPSMRAEALEQFGMRSTGVDSPEQREITDQLARQMQVEPDPLVRRAVVGAIAEFRTSMAQQVLEAGMADEDMAVRVACCQALGRRGEAVSVASLANALRSDENIDVRLAAAEALGKIKSPEAMPALAAALDDRDPALQYVGVQSLKSITGKDYGPDVETWRQVAAGGTPPPAEAPSIAERLRSASPF